MTTDNSNIPSTDTNAALADAWAAYQAALTARAEADATVEKSIAALAQAGDSKTFIADEQIYQVRSRVKKETGERFSFLTQYEKLPSEARKINHDAVVAEAQKAMLDQVRTSNPEAYKALCASLGIEEQADQDDSVEVEAPKAQKASKSKRAAKAVTVS